MKLNRNLILAFTTLMLVLASLACTHIQSPSAKALKAAEEAVSAGEYTVAVTQYQAVLAEEKVTDEEKLAAYRGLAQIFMSQEDYPQALTNLDQVVALAPTDYEALGQRGKVNLELGQYAQAISDIKGSLQGDVATAGKTAYYDLADAYLNLGEYPDAIDNYTKALDATSDVQEQADILTMRCFTYSEMNELENAMSDCNQAIELDANYALAYAYRSNIHGSEGHYEDAIADANTAIEIGTDLGDGTRSSLLHARALAYLNTGEYDACISDASDSIILVGTTSESAARTYNIRGECYYWMGDYQNALNDYNKAVELGVTDVAALNGFYIDRARAEYQLGDYPAAIADADASIGISSDPADVARALNLKGDIQYVQEDYTGAEGFYSQAVASNPDNALYQENLGWALYQQEGREIEAVDAFNAALAIDSDRVDSYIGLAYTYCFIDDAANSRLNAEKALSYEGLSQDTIDQLNELLSSLP